MSQYVVFNGSEVSLEVDIEFGALKTSVFIQPRGRATLEDNYQVVPLFLQLNPAVRQTSKAEFETQKALLTSRASYFQTVAASTAASNVATAAAPKTSVSSSSAATAGQTK